MTLRSDNDETQSLLPYRECELEEVPCRRMGLPWSLDANSDSCNLASGTGGRKRQTPLPLESFVS